MLNKKTILIASLGLASLAAVFVFIYDRRKAENPPAPVTTTTGEGGFNNYDSNTDIGRTGDPYNDPAQPYALNAPRSTEPAPITYQPPADAGPVADANGNYPQVINLSGSLQDGYDYSLSTDAFISQHYPNYRNVITSTGTSSDPVVLGADSTEDVSNYTRTITLSNYDGPRFDLNSNNDLEALQRYNRELTRIIGDFDIVNNPGLLEQVVDDYNTNAPYHIERTSEILSDLADIEVPSIMLGLHQSYYMAYLNYENFLTDMGRIQSATTEAQAASAVTLFESSASQLDKTFQTAAANLEIAAYLIESKQK